VAADTPSIYEREEATFEKNLGAIDDALSKARAELGAMTDAASAADTLEAEKAEYSLHEVPGMGRYAVVRKTGWQALLKVIHDLQANIDFSVNAYPGFDGVICKYFNSAPLGDPLNDHYEATKNLRDNIAAVRNFLMESYYVDTPAGMTPEKAKQAMDEIAKYIGQGLDNNYKFLGVIPNHHLGKPFISIDRASEPGGQGAQYLYDKILEIHRQSSWMRPFSAVIALFGGSAPPDWMLPPAHKTEFTDMFSHDIAPGGAVPGPSSDALKNGIRNVEILEGARLNAIDRHDLSNTALDLNMMGNQLLFKAGDMQNVANLSEPVRRDAIEIAKDILRKLKVGIGDINVKDGLNLPPTDDASALGAIKGVAMIYERMIGWARNIDPTIMQHPSVMAGVQAIGQIGYLAKREALRMAKIAGNKELVEHISSEMEKVPQAYTASADVKVGGLLDKIESGINVLMSRVQTISGPNAQIGNSASKDVGSSINTAPTAGLGQQTTAAGHNASSEAAKLNAQLIASEQAYQQAIAQRQQQQGKRQEISQQPQQQQQRPSGRQIFQQVRSQRQSTTVTSTTSSQNNPALRNSQNPHHNNAARIAQLQHDQDEQENQMRRSQEAQRQTAQLQAKAAADKASAQKIDPGMLKGFQSATNTRGMGPVASVKKSVTPLSQQPAKPNNFYGTTKPDPNAPKSPEDRNKNLPPNIPPPGKGGGRGF